MKSSRIPLLALGVGAYLAFAIASFPASIATRWFKPDSLALAGTTGTIWRGNVDYGGFDSLAFSDLRWQLHPAALLTGRLNLSVEARLTDGFVRSSVIVSVGRIRVRDLSGTTNLAALDGMLPLAGIHGNVSLQLDELELADGWPVAATGTLRIANLFAPPVIPVPGVTTIALGNYAARLTMSGETGIAAIVNDDGGPLELEGRADLDINRTYRLTARIRPRADATPELVEGLKIMAPAGADGWHSIEFGGPL